MENPVKIDDLGVPLFLETPMSFPPRNSAFILGWKKRRKIAGGEKLHEFHMAFKAEQ